MWFLSFNRVAGNVEMFSGLSFLASDDGSSNRYLQTSFCLPATAMAAWSFPYQCFNLPHLLENGN